MAEVIARFGVGRHLVTQCLFGAAERTGTHRIAPGSRVGWLGSELTHAGRRTRSWLVIGEVPAVGPGDARMPGFTGSLDLCVCVQQPFHHRKPGPVQLLLELVERLDEEVGDAARVPAVFWRAAGVSAGCGCGVRQPRREELSAWRRS